MSKNSTESILNILNRIKQKLKRANVYKALVPNKSPKAGQKAKGKNKKNWVAKRAPSAKYVKMVQPKRRIVSKASLPNVWVLETNKSKNGKPTMKYLNTVKTVSKLSNASNMSQNERKIKRNTNGPMFNYAMNKGDMYSKRLTRFFRKAKELGIKPPSKKKQKKTLTYEEKGQHRCSECGNTITKYVYMGKAGETGHSFDCSRRKKTVFA